MILRLSKKMLPENLHIPNLELEVSMMKLTPEVGTLGAGTVVPIHSRNRFFKMPVKITRSKQKEESEIIYTLSGESLSGDGLHDGDGIAVRSIFERSEITCRRICVVKILSTGELKPRHVCFAPDGAIVLRASNPEFEDMRLPADEVQVIGIVTKKIINEE